jgi:hypothetical protein
MGICLAVKALISPPSMSDCLILYVSHPFGSPRTVREIALLYLLIIVYVVVETLGTDCV